MANELTAAAAGPRYTEIEMSEVRGATGLQPASFGEVVAFSELMSRADVAIPKHLRQNPGACMAVTMRALRWEMDPFAVASKTYLVGDQIAYEAQLIAAVVHIRAPIKRRPDYKFMGEGDKLQCAVAVEMLDGTVKEYVSPKKGEIKVQNSPLWKSDPEQQLGYYSIRAWARRYAPEVILGVYTPDEMVDHAREMGDRVVSFDQLEARAEAVKDEPKPKAPAKAADKPQEAAPAPPAPETPPDPTTAPEPAQEATSTTGFVDFAGAVADANDWPHIQHALAELFKTPEWAAADDLMKANARKCAFHRLQDLNSQGLKFDFITNAHAWRCYIEFEDNRDVLQLNAAAFRGSQAFLSLSEPNRALLEKALAARMIDLEPMAVDDGGLA
ncbi:MAG TPA: recombinase RecT [Caulobacteraceae bacterium]|nr:recombinase RecT [Caulobacteraceae bacterium]